MEDLLTLPLRQYEQHHTGDIRARLHDDVAISSNIIPGFITMFVTGLLSCIIGIAYALLLSWKLTLIVFVLTPLAAMWAKRLMPLV